MYVYNHLGMQMTFSTINFMKSKYRSSISDKNLASELICAVKCKSIKDLVKKKEYKVTQ